MSSVVPWHECANAGVVANAGRRMIGIGGAALANGAEGNGCLAGRGTSSVALANYHGYSAVLAAIRARPSPGESTACSFRIPSARRNISATGLGAS